MTDDQNPPVAPEHDCLAGGSLEYRADYGAPGIGQAWQCAVCARHWARLGATFYAAEWGAHIMTPGDYE